MCSNDCKITSESNRFQATWLVVYEHSTSLTRIQYRMLRSATRLQERSEGATSRSLVRNEFRRGSVPAHVSSVQKTRMRPATKAFDDVPGSRPTLVLGPHIHFRVWLEVRTCVCTTPCWSFLRLSCSKEPSQNLSSRQQVLSFPDMAYQWRCVPISSDNCPQFSSRDFASFSRTYIFKHVTSSPGFPRSNGLAEKRVQVVKRILKKAGNEP